MPGSGWNRKGGPFAWFPKLTLSGRLCHPTTGLATSMNGWPDYRNVEGLPSRLKRYAGRTSTILPLGVWKRRTHPVLTKSDTGVRGGSRPPLRLATHLRAAEGHRSARSPGRHRAAQRLEHRLARRHPQDRAPRAPGVGGGAGASACQPRSPERRATGLQALPADCRRGACVASSCGNPFAGLHSSEVCESQSGEVGSTSLAWAILVPGELECDGFA